MVPEFKMVITPNCNWAALYWHSNIRDIKVWEGEDYHCGAIQAMALFHTGRGVRIYFFPDESQCDGSTPDTFSEIEGLHEHEPTT